MCTSFPWIWCLASPNGFKCWNRQIWMKKNIYHPLDQTIQHKCTELIESLWRTRDCSWFQFNCFSFHYQYSLLHNSAAPLKIGLANRISTGSTYFSRIIAAASVCFRCFNFTLHRMSNRNGFDVCPTSQIEIYCALSAKRKKE